MGDFEPDPFLQVLAVALGRPYPSAGAIRWANELVERYGEEQVSTALLKASKETDAGHVLSLTQQMLEFAAATAELVRDRQKEEELAQSRADRNRRELEYQRNLGKAATDTRPIGEIMGEMPWLKRG